MSVDIVGIGEEGLAGLRPEALEAVTGADLLVGHARHLALVAGDQARLEWPSPWDPGVIPDGRRVAVLVSGDPLWFSGGEAVLARHPGARVHPQVGAFQWAAARMGWPMASVTPVTVHGRDPARLRRHLAPGVRLVALGRPGDVAAELTAAGWGASRVTALWHLGGASEGSRAAAARDWSGETPALVTLAVECAPDPGTPVWPLTGLPDAAFRSDGTMTKREVRAVTLAALAPREGAWLWDIGTGAGSVAIEWMRAGGRAAGIEPRADRLAFARANARALGVPDLRLVEGRAPDALAGLPDPEAVFVGGGATQGLLALARDRAARVVANAVTLESWAVLMAAQAEWGGELVRLAVSRAEPVGGLTGWRPAMEVLQWRS